MANPKQERMIEIVGEIDRLSVKVAADAIYVEQSYTGTGPDPATLVEDPGGCMTIALGMLRGAAEWAARARAAVEG